MVRKESDWISDISASGSIRHRHQHLYAHFPSKDELIVAYLDQRNETWNEAVSACLATIANPTEKLLGQFNLYRDWLLKGGLRGCA
jgi:AcrR family transcriptional regulator